MPGRTFSAMPPMFEHNIGRRLRMHSWMTTGEFSHQIEGTSAMSAVRIPTHPFGLTDL